MCVLPFLCCRKTKKKWTISLIVWLQLSASQALLKEVGEWRRHEETNNCLRRRFEESKQELERVLQKAQSCLKETGVAEALLRKHSVRKLQLFSTVKYCLKYYSQVFVLHNYCSWQYILPLRFYFLHMESQVVLVQFYSFHWRNQLQPNYFLCFIAGFFWPAGPSSAQCVLEVLWWTDWHPPSGGATGAARHYPQAAQTLEGQRLTRLNTLINCVSSLRCTAEAALL